MPDLMRHGAIPLLLTLLAGCQNNDEANDQTPPPPSVSAIVVQGHAVPNIVELPGRIEAVRTAEVRARVDGIVQRRLYEEGNDVVAGTPLFQIDPREKRAALQQATANLQRTEAARANAARVVQRYTPLVGRKAISAQENDAAVSDLGQADANVAQARAQVDAARLELSYTLVRAPLSGRAGRALVTEGALVSAANATLMTQIDQLNPIYATFAQSSTEIQQLLDAVQSGALQMTQPSRVAVRLILETGKEYGQVGYIDFADQAVNPQTGTQTLRARFPNPARTLLPGQFVRARISAGVIANGISVPQKAVQFADKEAKITVVNRDGSAAIRTVALGAMIGGEWVVLSGLRPGERIIVDGWQKVQNGQKVKVRNANAANGGARPQAQPAAPAR
ncbi:MAG: efflux RND transporter periplasmic adaptor subunit [Sphingobium sp.]